MGWFWPLMTPFVGHNLDEAVQELETTMVDGVMKACVRMAHDREMAACYAVQQATIDAFRCGLHGSTIPDMMRISELEQQISAQSALIEALMAQLESVISAT